MKINYPCVIFCGLDGSGKSTQVNLLKEFCIKNNIVSHHVWLRSPNRLTLPFILVLKALGISYSVKTSSGRNIGCMDLHPHKILTKLWKKILLLDIEFVSWYKIKPYLKNRHLLIIDRFIIDTLVDLAIDIDDNNVISELGIQFLSLVPSNSQIFFLDIDPITSYERNHEESLDLLKRRKELYFEILKLHNIVVIDGTKSIIDIHKQIIQQVFSNK